MSDESVISKNDFSKESEDTFKTNPSPPSRPTLSREKSSFRPQNTERLSPSTKLKYKLTHYLSLLKLKCCKTPNDPNGIKIKSFDKETHFLSFFERNIQRFSNWVYRSPFTTLIFTCVFMYFLLVTLFAAILLGVSRHYHDVYGHDHGCITGVEFEEGGRADKFEYTFDLSWTTFSTVGYGLFSPQAEPHCWGIRFICAIEALTGILFASCSGAFLYSKINRIQYSAPVTFSRSMCLQYGKGLLDSDCKPTGTYFSANNLQRTRQFPFIEFRIVHNDCNKRKRAIVDASLSCYVILPTDTIMNLTEKDYSILNYRHSISYVDEEPVGYKEKSNFPGKVFHQLKIDNEKLPFYDKVWYVRHILDETSPLVEDCVKLRIQKEGGDHWPDELNNYESIRDSIIDFQLITVQLQGMSQVTASPVYAEMEYNFNDIYIGWQFTGLLYRLKDIYGKCKIVVDKRLIHDIAPQRGGGNEPIHDDD